MNKFFILVAFFLFSCGSSSKRRNSAVVQFMDSLAIAQKRVDPVFKRGEEIYNTYCIACHMSKGEGVLGMHPPLQRTEHTLGDKNTIIQFVIEGMEGEIKVKGKIYNNVMAPLGFLPDKDIAAVVTYVRQSFGNNVDGVTPEEVAALRTELMGTF